MYSKSNTALGTCTLGDVIVSALGTTPFTGLSTKLPLHSSFAKDKGRSWSTLSWDPHNRSCKSLPAGHRFTQKSKTSAQQKDVYLFVINLSVSALGDFKELTYDYCAKKICRSHLKFFLHFHIQKLLPWLLLPLHPRTACLLGWPPLVFRHPLWLTTPECSYKRRWTRLLWRPWPWSS